jgi:hypothetical protein
VVCAGCGCGRATIGGQTRRRSVNECSGDAGDDHKDRATRPATGIKISEVSISAPPSGSYLRLNLRFLFTQLGYRRHWLRYGLVFPPPCRSRWNVEACSSAPENSCVPGTGCTSSSYYDCRLGRMNSTGTSATPADDITDLFITNDSGREPRAGLAERWRRAIRLPDLRSHPATAAPPGWGGLNDN